MVAEAPEVVGRLAGEEVRCVVVLDAEEAFADGPVIEAGGAQLGREQHGSEAAVAATYILAEQKADVRQRKTVADVAAVAREERAGTVWEAAARA